MSKTRYTIIIIILSQITCSVLLADDWKELLDLKGYWKFNIGDDPGWAKFEVNDQDWEEIYVPSSWEDEGYHQYNGFAWYRLKFSVPKEIGKKNIYLSMGYIDDADEVYLNGTLVGSSGAFPPEFETAYNAYRKYPIPSNLFYPGSENVIAVRVYDARLNGGITSGDISIMFLESIDMELSLEGFWKFNIGDSLEWKNPNYSDSDWDSIPVPSNWEIQGYSDYNGFAWYRKTFVIGEELKGEKLVLMLGKIDDIDQCYLNGSMIGGTGNFKISPKKNYFQNEWLELRGYYIRDGIIKYNGENVISVRVYDGMQGGGIYHGPVGITTHKEYRNYWKKKKRKRNFWDYIFDK